MVLTPIPPPAAQFRASGQFPHVAGKNVAIKPNLVVGRSSATGATTDPQVVRAVVDECLERGAAAVHIGELGGLADNGAKPPPFGACGYDFFRSYSPRVTLEDWGQQTPTLIRVPNGFVYREVYLPAITQDPNRVWITAAKMKVHNLTSVTLGIKNSFGFFCPSVYFNGLPRVLPRTDPHLRGADQTLSDIHLARPMHFCVIDGIWGMETAGPIQGTPIAANVILAGANVLAVDRVALKVMGLPQSLYAIHLDFAAHKGLGPSNLSTITVQGDPLTVVPFAKAQLIVAPAVWPTAIPSAMSFIGGGTMRLGYEPIVDCYYRLEVIADPDERPHVVVKRTVFNWTYLPAASSPISVLWNGRDNAGNLLPPGKYLVRLLTREDVTDSNPKTLNAASNFVSILP
jgi:uncharacterized protein (DUF362 family)